MFTRMSNKNMCEVCAHSSPRLEAGGLLGARLTFHNLKCYTLREDSCIKTITREYRTHWI